MTGTAVTEAEEFANFYELEVVVIPTHKPILRVDLNDKLYLNQTAKWKYVKEFIKMYHEI
jgi:protein translocase subunit secA